MKKLLSLLLFFSVQATAMYPLFSSARNIRTHLDLPNNNFGRTHFITGKRYYNSPTTNPLAPQYVRRSKSLFAPKDDLLTEISTVISQAQKKIDVAAFALTDKRIADQLIDAHQRGVDICVIMDAGNMSNKYSKAQHLIDNGVCVMRYDPSLRKNYKKSSYEKIMHLKWIIADDTLVLGSANFTRSAQTGGNIESITVFNCHYEVADHRQAFQDLKQYCVVCKPTLPTGSTNTHKNNVSK
jgi:phosphatidylserine/phosphatidylglycerophosphate/cardiolipin synthase-like enzyme